MLIIQKQKETCLHNSLQKSMMLSLEYVVCLRDLYSNQVVQDGHIINVFAS